MYLQKHNNNKTTNNTNDTNTTAAYLTREILGETGVKFHQNVSKLDYMLYETAQQWQLQTTMKTNFLY